MADIVELPKLPAPRSNPRSHDATVFQFPDRGTWNWLETEFAIRKFLSNEEGRSQDLIDQVCLRLREVGRDPVMAISIPRKSAAECAEVIRMFQAANGFLISELVRREILLYEMENGRGKPPPQAA